MAAAEARVCGVAIRMLPDFLLDPNLIATEPQARLRELCVRWGEILQHLWPWGPSTLFCLRLVSQPDRGGVGVFLLARPPMLAQRGALQRDLEAALALHGVIGTRRDFARVLPLLDPAATAALDLPERRRVALAEEMEATFGPVVKPRLSDACFVGLTQAVTGELWANDRAVRDIVGDMRMGPLREAVKQEPLPAWIPLSWEGPDGTFLAPFAALAVSDTPLRLSIYAKPAQPTMVERLWLERLAAAALRDAPNTAAAALAARRCEAATRRWRDGAFLVAAECAALDGNREAATRIAHLVRTVALRTPPAADDAADAWAGVRIVLPDAGEGQEAAAAHRALTFPHWMDDRALPEPLRRLSFLADARGAATLFRLPIAAKSGVAGVAVAQMAPSFDPGPSPAGGAARRVVLGRYEGGGVAAVNLDDFTKHALITGFTGSGKTRTVLHVVHQLWAAHGVPVLVLESAKAEYRGLLGLPEFLGGDGPGLLVHTLGNESVSPFRLNPFELIQGVRVEAHVNRLKTCFEAAFPPFAPLSSIIEQSLIEVYRDLGWRMSDAGPGHIAMGERRWPDMTAFAAKLEAVGISRRYPGDNQATLLAATRGRVLPLTRAMGGSKGSMLDCATSWPRAEMLFQSPVVLEMNDLDTDDKALVSMFLLTLIREWREQQPRQRGLRHVTVIEEAHNVLAKVASAGGQEGAGADTRFKAVEAFCTMLAEIRALGEGIIIADQSPEKLATDAMRNTNIQIAHQLRDGEDRKAVARAMIMTDEQQDFIGRLLPGRAAVFFTGLQRASFIAVPPFGDAEAGGLGGGFRDGVGDAELSAYMEPISGPVRILDRPFAGCADCGSRAGCDFRWASRRLAENEAEGEALRKAFGKVADTTAAYRAVGDLAWRALALMPSTPELAARPEDAAWCWFLHLRHAWLGEYPPGGAFDRHSRGWFTAVTLPELQRRASEEVRHE